MPRTEPTNHRNRFVRALLFGLALGLAGATLGLSRAGLELEEDPVLGWLYRLRGPLPPPEDVALIAIDEASGSASLHRDEAAGRIYEAAPVDYRTWPRDLHARLVERLRLAGPRLIVFDIFFAKPRDGDVALASALRRVGKVLLVQQIDPVPSPSTRPDGKAPLLEITIETLRDPAPQLADAATAMAPFVVPKEVKVTQFWTFRSELNDTPTLPTVALQLDTLDQYPVLRGLLSDLASRSLGDLPPSVEALLAPPGLVATMRRLRQAFRADPQLHAKAAAAVRSLDAIALAERARLGALLDLYAADDSRQLKHYGPPKTFEHLSFAGVLAMSDAQLQQLRGKVIFVGVTTTEGDARFTPYPGEGKNTRAQGVEIAATAFANVLRNESIHPVGPGGLLALFLGWGLLVGTLPRLLDASKAIATIALLGAAYSLLVYASFVRLDLWLPWAVPIGAQAVPALALAIWLAYREQGQTKRRIAAALDRYLPAHVAAGLAADIYRASVRGQVLKGVCIATDGEQYTTLAERLDPDRLHRLLNDYYAVVFEPIRQSAGFVCDVVGDACLGLWIGAGAGTMQAERQRACEAAIDILEAVRTFNAAQTQDGIPIRIGLHFGEVFLGDIGAADHFEYRAVGDVVNTASRIEQVNKKLGTRLLVSAAVQEGVEGLVKRDLGLVQLAGKRKPIHLYELLGRIAACDAETRDFLSDFACALAVMQCGEWTQACARFTALLERRPDDGPSRFFAAFCEDGSARPQPPDARCIVQFDTK